MSQETTKIGLATATIIGMNAMIGSGIFSAPAAIASNVGPAGILAYIFVVISVWFMAQSLARLSALYPEEGSFYVFAKQWGGHVAGVVANGFYLIGLIIAMGLLAQMAGLYAQPFFPTVDKNILGAAILGGLVILNMFGVALSQLGQHILIVCTTFPLVIITFMCLIKTNMDNVIPFAPYGFTNVLEATRSVIFGFFGFECAASLFSIVKDPKKNVPKALTYAIMGVGTLYILFISSLILAIPLQYFGADIRITDSLSVIFPDHPWVLTIINVAILSAITGTIHSMIWSSSALLVSFVKKLFPQRKPMSHIMAVGIIGALIFFTFSTLHNINLFFSLTATFIVSAYLMSMLTLLTLKEEWKSGQNIKTIFGILTASAILYFALEGIFVELFPKI